MDYTVFPFGVKLSDLTLQYGESIMECGMKTSSDQGNACGAAGSRAGCWTCGMLSGNDPMLVRHIEEGKTKYQYLLEWKNLMLRMRNDIRFREVLPRQLFKKKLNVLKLERESSNYLSFFEEGDLSLRHRYESFKRASYEEYLPGAMTVMGRRILLEYLLFIQEETGYSLIQEDEIDAILNCWVEVDGISIKRDELNPREFDYDGELIFLPNKTINQKLTKNPHPVFYITVELNMSEDKLFEFLKERQQATGKSYFFFPSSLDFKKRQAVWNRASFVVCNRGIDNDLQAAEEVYKWLGWSYGSFTDRTHKAAINHLMLSAIGEALGKQEQSYGFISGEDLPEHQEGVFSIVNFE